MSTRPHESVQEVGQTPGPDHGAAARDVLQRVRTASLDWAALAPGERARQLAEAGRAMLARADELAELVHRETGKPLPEALSADVVGVADLFAYWCKFGPDMLRPRQGRIPKLEMPGKRAWIERRPLGVVAVISPWNFPVAIPMRNLLPALMAGNGVVLKPSELTPGCGRWLVEQLQAALGPVVGLLEGDGAAGEALIEAEPDMVVFTGSTSTGRKVAIACAQRGVRCASELGGKDCAIVLPDADLRRAAAGIAWGVLNNAGQNCASIERIAVHAAVADTFIPALIAQMERAAADVMEVVHPRQKAVIVAQIAQALDRGARALTGGLPEGERPLAPTLLIDVPRDADAWSLETFGPVAVLEVHPDEDALLAAANDGTLGLGASVWSEDLSRARTLGRQLRAGMVWINNHGFSAAVPDLPWVGVGGSGAGVTNSPDALHEMTRPWLLLEDGAKAIEPWWYPYGEAMTGLMHAVIARQRSGGLGAMLRTLKALKKRNAELGS